MFKLISFYFLILLFSSAFIVLCYGISQVKPMVFYLWVLSLVFY